MDLGGTLPPPLRFHITDPNGEFICVVQGLLFKGSILAYDLATNSAEWISVRGTVNDLSPVEDASAWELSNITIPDPPEDAPQIDHFGEHWQEHIAEAHAKAFHIGIVPCKGEEVMEDSPPDGENVSSDSSEESDSDEGTPRHCHSDSVSQAEEEGEDGEELAEESAEEFMEELAEEPAEEFAEDPTVELAEGPTEELAGEPTVGPAEGPAEETAVEHPTSG